MDIHKLDKIIRDCLWAGEKIATTQNPPPGMKLVNVHFHVVAVNEIACRRARNELIDLLSEYPEPERLKSGPSYTEIGAAIGDEMMALMLMAIGEGAGLWEVMTPKTLHITGEAADNLARQGFVMISGYEPTSVPATRR